MQKESQAPSGFHGNTTFGQIAVLAAEDDPFDAFDIQKAQSRANVHLYWIFFSLLRQMDVCN